MVSESERQAEIERIHTQATSIVLMRVCQLLDGIREELTAKKRQLGFTQKFCVDRATERECQGMIESMMECLADDLPVDPCNAVESQDTFDVLSKSEAIDVGRRVKQTVRELLGVFS